VSDEINKSVPSGTERCPKCMSPDKQRTFSKCRPRENEHAWHGHDQPTPAAQPDEYDKATIRKCCCEPGSPCKTHGVSAEATKPQCPTCRSCKRKERYGVIALGVCEYCHGHKQIAPHIFDDQDCPECKATGVKLCRDPWHSQPEWLPVRDVWDAKPVEEVAAPVPPTVNYLQQLPGGMCFAHGRYEGMQCPKWPACAKVATEHQIALQDNDHNTEDCPFCVRMNNAKPESVLAPSQVKAEGAREWLMREANQYCVNGEFGVHVDHDSFAFVDENRNPIPIPMTVICRVLDEFATSRLVEKQAEISRLTQGKKELLDSVKSYRSLFQDANTSLTRMLDEGLILNKMLGIYDSGAGEDGEILWRRIAHLLELEAANASLKLQIEELNNWMRDYHESRLGPQKG
jgi:hypothetical protein